ncbi:MAG TPA: hypothetical protein EYO59_10040 [Chromatiaceae bacterium]|nr:hypothetical protein [Chromatiaceae bacterium]
MCLAVAAPASPAPHHNQLLGIFNRSRGNSLDGNHFIQFSIYNVRNGGVPLWTETQIVSGNNPEPNKRDRAHTEQIIEQSKQLRAQCQCLF